MFRVHKDQLATQFKQYDGQKVARSEPLMTADKAWTACFVCEKLFASTATGKASSWAIKHSSERGGCAWEESMVAAEHYCDIKLDIGQRDPLVAAKVATWFAPKGAPKPVSNPITNLLHATSPPIVTTTAPAEDAKVKILEEELTVMKGYILHLMAANPDVSLPVPSSRKPRKSKTAAIIKG
jgi:hypothetical protein